MNILDDPIYQQELNKFLQQEYIEDDFLVDDEIDEGLKPEGDYSILEVDEWKQWYYGEENKSIDDKSLQLLDDIELESVLSYVDFGMNQPTGLYDSQVLTTIQLSTSTLEEIIKGLYHVSESGNIIFIYSIAKHTARTITVIPTKANPNKIQIVPEYYQIKWTKLKNNYDQVF